MKINARIEKTNKTLKDMLKLYMWNKLGTYVGYMEITICVTTLSLGL